ncbi:uncharacterized protein LOC126849549 [Cataglyphis hispanica]|uniref:uncharacterized protein LOC126849549 n=1 Tax=Cataglyphis hispanica TaxID=1086592 RepID=UPI00217FE603|nr:uncharacterized protein LOC126849549 [Cataglyphis hispanica]
MMLVNYKGDKGIYKLYDPGAKCVIEARNMVFNEGNVIFFKKNGADKQQNNNNFEAILDESDEDHALSDDSDYISNQSEDLTEIVDRVVSHSEIIALNGRTKCCTIYFCYSTGGALALCTSCMISVSDTDFGYMYTIRRHVTELHDAVDGRFCSNCRNPLYQIFPCNMCPICTLCLHYFESNNKLQSHMIDCQQMNECAIRLPSEKDKWLEFNNYNRKELLPFVVYADLECMLKKTNNDPIMSTYTFQHHEVFSVAYYIHCAYDETLSAYYSRRNVDCITWFVEELKNLAHRVKNIISANVPMVTLSHEQCETFRSATHCHICEKPFAPDDTRVRDHCHLTGDTEVPRIQIGIFPYEYIDCVDRLEDTCLPPRDSFHNSLTGDTVSESDYAHAETVWKRFSIRTLGEYSDLYLKTDVLLLADIFENFDESCIKSYGLDPAYYYTLPGFTWDAMLKHTNIKFELLTDIDMAMFIERGIRGGLSQCSGRYAHANNKYMRSYDPSKSSSYLMYFDVNNLYGWAMCQPLPYADFRWVDDISDFNISAIASDSPIGYILEVDLEYPQHLHNAHADLPFCPIRDKPPGKREDKLLATLYDKKRYVIHYRNLQQCTRHGLRVTKIHRVLQFAQSAWLRDYIELNTKFRTLARNDFEKNLFKLMNNAVFGKTMENVRNHVEVKLLTKWDGRYGAEAMIAKPNFHSRSIFSENLVAVELRKLEVKFNKPIYVGMCILDISKVCLYEFHHEYMLPLYHENCKVMYTDTDSLIYYIKCDDIYENMKRDIDRFDTSDYPANNAYDIPLVNKKVPGLMKDENNGAIMTEFVGLRAKMYALRVDGKKDTKKIKGVKSNVVARTITFDDYTRCLHEEIEMTRQQSCIRSKLHEVYTIRETKIALSPYDDKRYIVPDSTNSLPWGHYRIPL